MYVVIVQVVKLQAGIEYGKEDFVSAEVCYSVILFVCWIELWIIVFKIFVKINTSVMKSSK